MTAHFDVMVGDCRTNLRALAAVGFKAQMCVTSPPYFGLRDYGMGGQLGLEETPEQYIAAMVEVFRCVRDVLADDATLWVNIGDSYASTGGHGGIGATSQRSGRSNVDVQNARKGYAGGDGIKTKDLIGIPWMLAFALRADGWYLRQEIIWHKPNPMPESVTDRCTKAHESLFLLSKSPRYYFDHEAIKEPAKEWTGRSATFDRSGNAVAEHVLPGQSAAQHRPRPSVPRGGFNGKTEDMPGRNAFRAVVPERNRRSVWSIATRPYSGAHFAVFPPALVEPCILAGTSERGHCPACGARWSRVVEKTPMVINKTERNDERGTRTGTSGTMVAPASSVTTGWAASCTCGRKAAPDMVIDPFGGSGTTAGVAVKHGRTALMFELNQAYAELMPARVASIVGVRP